MVVQWSVEPGILRDYLAYLFPPDPEAEAYLVSATRDIGRMMIGFVKVSDRPVKPPQGAPQNIVRLKLPLLDATQNMRDRWLYYTSADASRLRMILRATFNMDFDAYYLEGLSRGISKKEIVEMFIVSRKLVNVDPYEALHKRAYRNEQRRQQCIVANLLRKAKYFDESMDTSGMPDKN